MPEDIAVEDFIRSPADNEVLLWLGELTIALASPFLSLSVNRGFAFCDGETVFWSTSFLPSTKEGDCVVTANVGLVGDAPTLVTEVRGPTLFVEDGDEVGRELGNTVLALADGDNTVLFDMGEAVTTFVELLAFTEAPGADETNLLADSADISSRKTSNLICFSPDVSNFTTKSWVVFVTSTLLTYTQFSITRVLNIKLNHKLNYKINTLMNNKHQLQIKLFQNIKRRIRSEYSEV